MKNNWTKFILKILILTSVFTTTYYLILTTSSKHQKELLLKESILATNITNLSQNRIAYVELTRLDAKDTNFNMEKSDLVSTIKETNQYGLANADFPTEGKEIYQRQNDLLEKVFATNTFEEGVAILKSEEALELLTNQTTLLHLWQRKLQELEKQIE